MTDLTTRTQLAQVDVMTTREAAMYVCIGENQLRDLANAKKLRTIKLGDRKMRFSRTQLLEDLQNIAEQHIKPTNTQIPSSPQRRESRAKPNLDQYEYDA